MPIPTLAKDKLSIEKKIAEIIDKNVFTEMEDVQGIEEAAKEIAAFIDELKNPPSN